MPLAIPVQQEIARNTSMPLFSKNVLESPWGGYRLSLGDPSPGEGNLELTNAPTNSYYHHIDAAYDCSMYYQLSNLFCLCPG